MSQFEEGGTPPASTKSYAIREGCGDTTSKQKCLIKICYDRFFPTKTTIERTKVGLLCFAYSDYSTLSPYF